MEVEMKHYFGILLLGLFFWSVYIFGIDILTAFMITGSFLIGYAIAGIITAVYQ